MVSEGVGGAVSGVGAGAPADGVIAFAAADAGTVATDGAEAGPGSGVVCVLALVASIATAHRTATTFKLWRHPIRLRRLDRWFLMHSQLSFEEVRVDV
jgi:hypothetical protein